MATTSGTYNFALDGADITIECYDRMQIRPASLTTDHLRSAGRSFNLVQSRWANRGVNLWTVGEVTIPMVQGIGTYAIDPTTIFLAPDTFLRQYQMGSPESITPAFATTIHSPTVTVTQANNGVQVGQYVSIVVPVSVGGLILVGFYLVQSTPTVNTYTITAGSNATATATGGAVPVFTTTANSTSASVLLNNHNYLPGQSFTVQVSTEVGGVTFFGTYTISAVTDANNFVIALNYGAATNSSGGENAGQTQIATQNMNATPTDILLYPLSRNDYAAIPLKTQQGRPTSYWFDRLISPTVVIWPQPDANGPYELHYWRAQQIQDVSPQFNQAPQIPYRFFEAFCAAVAAHLAMKWAPQSAQLLNQYAVETWKEASDEDREKVSFYFSPDFTGYF